MKKHRSTKIFNWSLSLTNRCQAGVSGDKCDQSPTWVLRMKKRRLTTMDDDGYVEMARKRLMAVLAKFVRDEKNEGIEDKEAVEREEKLQHWGGKSASFPREKFWFCRQISDSADYLGQIRIFSVFYYLFLQNWMILAWKRYNAMASSLVLRDDVTCNLVSKNWWGMRTGSRIPIFFRNINQ